MKPPFHKKIVAKQFSKDQIVPIKGLKDLKKWNYYEFYPGRKMKVRRRKLACADYFGIECNPLYVGDFTEDTLEK